MRKFILGAGGHGKVVCDILQTTGSTVDAFVDSSNAKTKHCGLPVTRSLGDRVVGYGTPCKVVRVHREDEMYL